MEVMPSVFEATLQASVAFGVWQSEYSIPQVVAAAATGYKFICLDMQHPLVGMTNGQLVEMTYAIRATNPSTAVLIRVPSPDPACIAELVQLGSDGLVVPNVDTPQQALAAWEATRFSSQGGKRSISGAQVSNSFGTTDWRMPTVICQLESQQAETNLDLLMGVAEVRHWFIGPMDFAVDCGGSDPWEIGIRERIDIMAGKVQKAGKKIGIMEAGAATASGKMQELFDFIALGPVFAATKSALTTRLATANRTA